MILLGPAERIFDLAEKKFSQKEFAAALGVKPQRVSDWKRGLSSSYQKYISQIATILGTTTEYLLTGEGPKEKNTPADVSNSDTETQLVAAAYRRADERTQTLVRLALGLDDETAIAARGGTVIKKPSPVSAETLTELSRATETVAAKENDQF